jgi:DNA-binding GntR family transcriptional regulator
MNDLHRTLAEKILTHIRTSDLEIGHHLTEQSLQERFGASRPPIRAALNHLDELGVIEKKPNHGYFVTDPNAAIPTGEPANSTTEALYFQIADDRLSRILPDRISENELMRRYNVSRIILRRMLMRISAEGWIERNEGRGWTFAALIDSVEAYRESYELRQLVETHGLAASGFKHDKEVLGSLRRTQKMIQDGGWLSLTQTELVETNYRFHEGLAQLSGNRFVLGTVQKLNQLRRLVEYRQTLIHQQVKGQNTEHLDILDAIDDGNLELAAKIMSDHLGGAKDQKARADLFVGFSAPPLKQ